MKFFLILLVSVMLILLGFQPVFAINSSRFLVVMMYLTGMGSGFFSVYSQSQANKIYDDYLHTSVKSEMDRLIDDYAKKRQQSKIAFRAGVGLVTGAVVVSVIDAVKLLEPTQEKESNVFGFSYFDSNIEPNEIRFRLISKHAF